MSKTQTDRAAVVVDELIEEARRKVQRLVRQAAFLREDQFDHVETAKDFRSVGATSAHEQAGEAIRAFYALLEIRDRIKADADEAEAK